MKEIEKKVQEKYKEMLEVFPLTYTPKEDDVLEEASNLIDSLYPGMHIIVGIRNNIPVWTFNGLTQEDLKK